MKVTVKSNVTFKKLKKANLEKMVFDNLIRPLGKEAKKKVDNSFKNNKDINGEPYEPLSYTYGRKKKELGKGGNPIMVFDGDLKKSISKLLTNKSDMSVTIKSEDSRMLSKRGLNYGAFHLTGKANSRRKNPKIRKWFFTVFNIEFFNYAIFYIFYSNWIKFMQWLKFAFWIPPIFS